MIKAVFFDFYNTLGRFDPPREELQAVACGEFGIQMLEYGQFTHILTPGNLFHRREARQHFKTSGKIVFGIPNERMAIPDAGPIPAALHRNEV